MGSRERSWGVEFLKFNEDSDFSDQSDIKCYRKLSKIKRDLVTGFGKKDAFRDLDTKHF